MIMRRKTLITGIIVVLITVVALGISGCRCQRNPTEGKSIPTQTETETPAKTPKQKEMEEIRKYYSLFKSKITQADYSINGIVEEISGRNLTIAEFTDNKEREETSSLVVPIKEDAEIIANYILYIFPKGATNEEIDEYLSRQFPEEETGEETEEFTIEIPEGMSEEEIDEYIEEYLKRQTSEKETGLHITTMITGPKGEIWYFAGKGISFEEIKIGDIVFIVLDSKSGSEAQVEVWPEDFLITQSTE